MVSEGDRDSGGLELVILRVRTNVWANKERCTTSMAWAGYYVHKYGGCYYENWIKQSIEESMAFESMAFESMAFDGILA
jgi:hypothetical protein